MLATIDAALRARLGALRDAQGLRFFIDSYAGPLDDALLRLLAQRAPGIYVTFSDLTPLKQQRNGFHRFDAHFTLLLAGKAVNPQAAQTGGRAGKIIGAFELADFALFALSDFCHPLLERPFAPERLTNLITAQAGRNHLAIYSLALRCTLAVSAGELAVAALDDFEEIAHSARLNDGDSPLLESLIPQQEV